MHISMLSQSTSSARKTTSTGYEPKKLATVSRKEDYHGDLYQLYDAPKEFGEENHQAPITEEMKEFGAIGIACLPDSKISETSYFNRT